MKKGMWKLSRRSLYFRNLRQPGHFSFFLLQSLCLLKYYLTYTHIHRWTVQVTGWHTWYGCCERRVKKVIAAMTVGTDVSMLFTDVLKRMQTADLELKKLVYLYIMNYAKSKPDLAILAVTHVQEIPETRTRWFVRWRFERWDVFVWRKLPVSDDTSSSDTQG